MSESRNFQVGIPCKNSLDHFYTFCVVDPQSIIVMMITLKDCHVIPWKKQPCCNLVLHLKYEIISECDFRNIFSPLGLTSDCPEAVCLTWLEFVTNVLGGANTVCPSALCSQPILLTTRPLLALGWDNVKFLAGRFTQPHNLCRDDQSLGWKE